MKKATMKSIVSFIDTLSDVPAEMVEARAELVAELSKGEAKAQANRDLYETAKPVILGALSETPVTISELYDEIADALPEGFTKSKVQYAITRMWADEVAKVEGKVNGYTRKA